MITQTLSLRIARLVLLFALILFGLETVYAAKYSNKSLKGCYVGSIQGTALVGNPPQPTPNSSVFIICADGKGKLKSVKSKWNISGICLLTQEMEKKGDGTYKVAKDGSGTVSATVKVTGVLDGPPPNPDTGELDGCGLINPEPTVGSTATFDFAIVIDGQGCMEVISTKLVTEPEGAQVPLPIEGQGHACKQK